MDAAQVRHVASTLEARSATHLFNGAVEDAQKEGRPALMAWSGEQVYAIVPVQPMSSSITVQPDCTFVLSCCDALLPCLTSDRLFPQETSHTSCSLSSHNRSRGGLVGLFLNHQLCPACFRSLSSYQHGIIERIEWLYQADNMNSNVATFTYALEMGDEKVIDATIPPKYRGTVADKHDMNVLGKK
jgi:hypothetical protein